MSEQHERVRRLGLLASALAGRRVEVSNAEPATSTWTDGLTIHVDDALSAAQAVQAVAVHAALLGAGSFAPDVVSELRRHADLCPRYLAIEGRRALSLVVDLLPPSVAAFATGVTTSASAEDSLAVARSGVPIEASPAVFGQIVPRAILPAAASATSPAEPTAVRMSRTLREIDDADDLDSSDLGAVEDLSSAVGGGGAIGRLLQRLTAGVRSRDAGSPGADSATHAARRGRAEGRRTGRVGAAAQVSGATAELGRPAAETYPEWDCHRVTYRQDWCTVRRRDAEVGPPLRVNENRALRRALARVMPDLTRVRRQMQGNDVDIDAAVTERVDVAAGVSADEAVYVDDLRRRRDLAVLVLLDVSASAAEPSATRAPVHDHQRAAAAALAISLHDLGDRVAVDAFRSMGRDNVEVIAIKRFDEAADVTMLRRFGGLTAGAYTRLGAAIRHGCATLDREAGTARRLLIVVSDGFAYDHGYEGRYGESDARRALAEARRSGVGCLCLSIGGVTEADALTRVFGTAAHASITDLAELPPVVAALFPAAVRSADHRRRTWQHTNRSRQRQDLDRRTA